MSTVQTYLDNAKLSELEGDLITEQYIARLQGL